MQSFSQDLPKLLGDFWRLGAHHHRQEFEIPGQGALQEGQFYFEGMLLVVSHPGQSVTQGFFEMRIQLRNGFLVHRDLAQRGGVSGMGSGEQRLVKGWCIGESTATRSGVFPRTAAKAYPATGPE